MRYLLLIALLITVPSCSYMMPDLGSKTTETVVYTDGVVKTTVTEAGINNSDIVSWTEAAQKFYEQDAIRLTGMADAMYSQPSHCGGNKACEAYESALKDISLGFGVNFSPKKFDLDRPTSGYDIADTAVKTVGSVANAVLPIALVVDLGKSIAEGVGNTSINAGGDVAINDSLNRTETHATAIDGSTANSSTEQESEGTSGQGDDNSDDHSGDDD